MAKTITISNNAVVYISNNPYSYPPDDKSSIEISSKEPDKQLTSYYTGWHIVPNILWKHFVTPKQWFDLIINYEAYHVKGYKITLFNMIPLTTQLAIQGNTIFTAFNNCVYGLGYQDELYETAWHNWYGTSGSNTFDPNLMYKEGLMFKPGTATKTRTMWPIYYWEPNNAFAKELWTWNMIWFRDNNLPTPGGGAFNVDGVYPGEGYKPTGLVWDPFNRPNHLMELRPGKNAITFSWERHPCDADKWFNLDMMASWFPYTATGPYNYGQQRPGEYKLSGMQDPNLLSSKFQYHPTTVVPSQESYGNVNDYSIPNLADTPIVPMQWWWQEIQKNISPVTAGATDKFLKYLNMFFAGTEKECYMYGPTQCFVKMIPIFDSNNTNIECTAQIAVKTELILDVKNRRSAIYCPTYGPMPWRAVYSGRREDRNFFTGAIRYRTGGMRRGWQNLGDSNDIKAHPRKTPYITTTVVPPGTGQGSTFVTPTKATTTQTRPRVLTKVVPSAPDYPMETLPGTDHPYPPIDEHRR